METLEKTSAKTILHKAATRGGADWGWLKAKHTFSFANYHDPSRIHFGVLRVLNDDYIMGGRGFGMHPHDNMEIITIPLEGVVEHKDNTGGHGTIGFGEVQVMSAGTGVYHSEFNHSPNEALKLLQIWLFPKVRNAEPRYDQLRYDVSKMKNNFLTIVTPDDQTEEGAVWIHQDAWFSLGNLDNGFETKYKIKKEGNGVYVFVISGDVSINGQSLNQRDGLGIWDVDSLQIKADSDAQVLLMDVPMRV